MNFTASSQVDALLTAADDSAVNAGNPCYCCQASNGRKGCSRGTACNYKHACSAMLAAGNRPCDGSDHGAAGHDPASHGAAQ